MAADVVATLCACATLGLVGLIGTPPPAARRRWATTAMLAIIGWLTGALVAYAVIDVTRFNFPVLSLVACFGAGFATGLLPSRFGGPAWAPTFGIQIFTGVAAGTIVADCFLLYWVRSGDGPSFDLKATVCSVPVFWPMISMGLLVPRLVREMQDRERDLRELEAPEHERRRVRDSNAKFGEVAWFRIIALGVAATIIWMKLGAEVVTAATPFDAAARQVRWDVTGLLLTGIALAAVAALVRSGSPVRGGPHVSESAPRSIELTPIRVLLVMAVLAGLAVVPHLFSNAYEARGWAAVFGLLTYIGIRHSLSFHVAREHGAYESLVTRVVVRLSALAAASVVYWLIASGLWVSGRPGTARDTVGVVLISLLTMGLTIGLVGGVLCRARTGRFISMYSPQQNLSNDMLQHTAMPVIAAVLPALADSHLRHADPDDIRNIVLFFGAVSVLGIAVRFLLTARETIKRFVREAQGHDPGAGGLSDAADKHFLFLQLHAGAMLAVGAVWTLVLLGR